LENEEKVGFISRTNKITIAAFLSRNPLLKSSALNP